MIKDQRDGIRIRRVGSVITALSALGSGITDHGIGISSFLGIKDQGRKLDTLLESRIRNLCTKMGSAIKKNIPRYHPAFVFAQDNFYNDIAYGLLQSRQ